MNLFITDPVTKQPSVSLTITMVSFIAVLTAGSLQMAGKVETTSLFLEVFYSSIALYFGRRLNINNKTFSSDKAEEIKEKVESK